ncbi:hypothetical protein [Thalassotalea profundi]|uniref:Uncharacterized protein n=1 Tax=Thalassotalea profundi TaxID=2036687 RepID=A0ABQ3IIY2_9GAMM|nr:hypothetical protein [Thalassotalea profundi]GHE85176.1 hypothetical protein GCM10011501_12670 [Thalassotalea profundi]
MKLLNTLLSITISTILFASTASAQTLEIEKAEPINLDKLHATVKVQLQETMAVSSISIVNNELPIITVLKNTDQQEKRKTMTLANISYNAE